jgi:hypothetical protein
MFPPRRLHDLALLTTVLFLSGCDMISQIKDGVAQSAAVAESIELQVGKKPTVFGFSAGADSFSQVMVQFSEVPAAPLHELERIARIAVIKEFKYEPSALVIAFSYGKPAH